MDFNADSIEAEVYFADESRSRYYVKITFIGAGMYINSFVVQPSKFEGQPFWVQPPKHPQGHKKWVTTVDFEKDCELWKLIEQKATEAVEDYQKVGPIFNPNKQLDLVVEDIPEGPITLDDLPFDL